MHNLFFSLISFIIAIFFVLLGIISVMIPWSEEVRYGLVRFILEDALAISLFGCAFIVVGLAIAVNILLNSRRKYYHLRSGCNAIGIDENVIQQYLTVYWQQLFPDHDIPYRLTIKHNKIHINVDLPHLPLQEQRQLLERIKQDLQQLFTGKLGYQEEFYLTASFIPAASV